MSDAAASSSSDHNPDQGQSHSPTTTHQPPFPAHSQSRVWFLTAGSTPIAIALAARLVEHGDSVVAGILPAEHEKSDARREDLKGLLAGIATNREWKERFKIIRFDIRSVGDCQSAIAETVEVFGRLDVLFCCNSEALIGTIEELAQTSRTHSLVTEQFATNFFGPVNIIKASLPTLRAQRSGHIILLTGITGHLGTPGLGMYCASQWATEGYCDSLAYEIAPFNIKMSIVQSNMEVVVLTNKLIAVPPLAAYQPPTNMAPLSRTVLGRILDRLDEVITVTDGTAAGDGVRPSEKLAGNKTTELYPELPRGFKQELIAETVHAILAIGGHENPPGRHIVGHEGVASVKEKLRTVSEELEDFVEVSAAVDL